MRAGANVDDLAGDVAGSFRSQKNHRVRDVVRVDRSPERSERNVLGDHGLDVVQVAALVVEGSKYEARSNRIGSHADRTEFIARESYKVHQATISRLWGAIPQLLGARLGRR